MHPRTHNGPPLPNRLPQASVGHFTAPLLPLSGEPSRNTQYNAQYVDSRTATQSHGRRSSQPYPYPPATNSSHAANTVGPIGPVRSHHDQPTGSRRTSRKDAPLIPRKDKHADARLPGTRIPLPVHSLARFDDAGPMPFVIHFSQLTEDMQIQPFVHVIAPKPVDLISGGEIVMGVMPDRRIKLRILVCHFPFPPCSTITNRCSVVARLQSLSSCEDYRYQ